MKLVPLLLFSLISIILFVGGIIILLSQIPFWSIFLGITATQIGIVFLIFSYEKLSNDSALESVLEENQAEDK
jgi:energy-converting hydrogenase Eha subunit C